MYRLRAPEGCPWDREQTFDSIKPYTLEETYEVLEAIDNRDWKELTGELGDLLLQVLFYAEMAKEQGSFSIDDVLDRLSKKLVDRHPHVFGEVKADTADDVKRNWEALKAEERKKRAEEKSANDAGNGEKLKPAKITSALAGVSSAMPSLLEAHKLSSRAAQTGFDWPHIESLLEKPIRRNHRTAPASAKNSPARPAPRRPWRRRIRTQRDFRRTSPRTGRRTRRSFLRPGKHRALSFARLRIGPAQTNRKFRRRFEWMEARLYESHRTADQANMEELESLWQQAKQQEKHS